MNELKKFMNGKMNECWHSCGTKKHWMIQSRSLQCFSFFTLIAVYMTDNPINIFQLTFYTEQRVLFWINFPFCSSSKGNKFIFSHRQWIVFGSNSKRTSLTYSKWCSNCICCYEIWAWLFHRLQNRSF